MNKTKYKNLDLFFIASLALMLAGFLIAENEDLVLLSALITYNIIGIFFIYRINDTIDQHLELKFRILHFFTRPLHLAVSLLFVASLFFTLDHISIFTFIILSICGFIGLLYSITFRFRGKKYRLKNIFLFKNVFIGICWGGLILAGAGNTDSENVWMLFGFTSIQVMIGSIIRDFPDIEKDAEQNVHTLPLVMETQQAFIYMHMLNVASVFFAYLSNDYKTYEILFFAIVLFRGITLFKVKEDIHSNFWSQKMNLFTCLLILLIVIIAKYLLN